MNRERASRLASLARDKPHIVSASITILVAFHAAVGHSLVHVLSPGRALVNHATPGDASVLFLGGATVAAMVAGLAGVVVVFALSAPGQRIRTFRLKGGGSLLSNWTSAVAVSFVAAALCLVASFLRLTGARLWGWFFELALMLLGHGALRLIWLLRNLARIVAKEDKTAAEEADAVDVSQVVLVDEEQP